MTFSCTISANDDGWKLCLANVLFTSNAIDSMRSCLSFFPVKIHKRRLPRLERRGGYVGHDKGLNKIFVWLWRSWKLAGRVPSYYLPSLIRIFRPAMESAKKVGSISGIKVSLSLIFSYVKQVCGYRETKSIHQPTPEMSCLAFDPFFYRPSDLGNSWISVYQWRSSSLIEIHIKSLSKPLLFRLFKILTARETTD